MLSQQLIESALALTWINLLENNISKRNFEWNIVEFSIEKFFFYLLSLDFLYKYVKFIKVYWEPVSDDKKVRDFWVRFLDAIFLYQSGNEKPLIELLSKIWTSVHLSDIGMNG